MENTKRKRGRPPKKRLTETTGLTAEGAVNYALDCEIKSELQAQLESKSHDTLTPSEQDYLKSQQERKSRTLNIRFSESEYQGIIEKCEQFGYKKKSEYVRDCVRARISLATQTDFAETNRQIKAIGNNINQIAVRLHSTGNCYAEDLRELRRGVEEIWQLLLSIQSEQQSAQRYDTSLTQIRPSTDFMSRLISAEPTAEVLPRTSPESDSEEQEEVPF